MIPYYDFGGTGPILHFAHSNGYPPACFRQLLEPFTKKYHVTGICFRPLWPDSQPEELDSWQTISDDLNLFFEQQGYEQVIGVGHSLGAVATMKSARRYPKLFRAIVLIEPVFMPPDILSIFAVQPQAAKQTPLYQKTIKRRTSWPDRQTAFDHFRPKAVFQRWPDQALMDYVTFALYDNDQGRVELTYPREWEAHIYTQFPESIWQEIPQVTQPTLAIRGAESDTLFPQAWQLWQELQPQARFVEIPDAGHMVPMERPGQVTSLIFEFLNILD